jgi:hypothetical protein
VTVNVAEVTPAATVTLARTVAAEVLLLDSVTVRCAAVPAAGAFSVTVPVEFVIPPGTLVGLRETDETEGRLTISEKLWTKLEPTPLAAVKLMLYVPAVVVPGVPLSTPVEALNVTPLGKVPASLSVGGGKPVAVTVNVPASPTVKLVVLALVIAGACWTVRIKLCTAAEPTPLEAVN